MSRQPKTMVLWWRWYSRDGLNPSQEMMAKNMNAGFSIPDLRDGDGFNPSLRDDNDILKLYPVVGVFTNSRRGWPRSLFPYMLSNFSIERIVGKNTYQP